MKKCIIFGNHSFSELMCEYIENYMDIRVEAFTVNSSYINCKKIMGIDVVPYENLKESYSPKETSILVTSGYRGMSELRKRISLEVLEMGYSLQSFIHPSANLYGDRIGQGNIILENVIIGKHVCIGDGNILWNGVNISHHSIINNYNFLAPSCVIGGRVHMGDNCFCGLNSTIKGGINVENYTLIGASAYLDRDSKEYDVDVPGVRGELQNKNSLEMLR